MPKYVNPNTYPIHLSISQPVAVQLIISPHSWPASRLAFNAQQIIELPEAVARNFTSIGMLALAPEDGTLLAVSPPRPLDDKKVALTTQLPPDSDFDEDDFGRKKKRPVTLSTKIAPPAIPKGKGTYVVAELPDKRILFLSGPVLQEVGLQRFAEHHIGFPTSGYTRLSLVFGDNEEEASRARRYGHFLEKVIKEHAVQSASPGTVPLSTAVAAELYEISGALSGNIAELDERATSYVSVEEVDAPPVEKKARARKPKSVKPPADDAPVEVQTSVDSALPAPPCAAEVDVTVLPLEPGETVRQVKPVYSPIPENVPEVSPKVIPKFTPPTGPATPKTKAVFSFKPKPKVTP